MDTSKTQAKQLSTLVERWVPWVLYGKWSHYAHIEVRHHDMDRAWFDFRRWVSLLPGGVHAWFAILATQGEVGDSTLHVHAFIDVSHETGTPEQWPNVEGGELRLIARLENPHEVADKLERDVKGDVQQYELSDSLKDFRLISPVEPDFD